MPAHGDFKALAGECEHEVPEADRATWRELQVEMNQACTPFVAHDLIYSPRRLRREERHPEIGYQEYFQQAGCPVGRSRKRDAFLFPIFSGPVLTENCRPARGSRYSTLLGVYTVPPPLPSSSSRVSAHDGRPDSVIVTSTIFALFGTRKNLFNFMVNVPGYTNWLRASSGQPMVGTVFWAEHPV